MKLIGYTRVSLDKQAEQGCSLDAQAEKIRQYASLYGIELVEVIVDGGFSAKDMNRPGLQKALDKLKRKEADGLIIYKLDRLTRSVMDLGRMVQTHFSKGSTLISVVEQIDTSSASGRMVINLLTVVSQWEREAIGERTKAVMQHKRARGEYVGEAPFGWRVGPDGVRLEENPDEQRVIRLIAKLRDGGLSIRQIATRLNAEQVPARGKQWHRTSVERVLRRVA